ncbi:hypothetical protein [Aquabacterium humicola]|uniref:hypothetical protein n=1 Tax=Aquabacterium humicola TaxID=3237377 RepID=UPI002543AEF6|nr:hypothetical protein [Rubrivivax pictus]
MTTRLAAIGPSLVLAPPKVSDAQLQALSLGLCWGQAVARNAQRDPGSQAYFDALCAELGRTAWTVQAGQTFASHQSGSNLRVSAIVPALIQALVDADSARLVRQLFADVAAASAASPLAGFAGTWWASQKSTLLSQAFAVGPARIGPDGALATTLVCYGFGVQASSWQSFFVAAQSNSLDIEVRSVELSLNEALWSSISGAITQRLGTAAIAAIQQLAIDL